MTLSHRIALLALLQGSLLTLPALHAEEVKGATGTMRPQNDAQRQVGRPAPLPPPVVTIKSNGAAPPNFDLNIPKDLPAGPVLGTSDNGQWALFAKLSVNKPVANNVGYLYFSTPWGTAGSPDNAVGWAHFPKYDQKKPAQDQPHLRVVLKGLQVNKLVRFDCVVSSSDKTNVFYVQPWEFSPSAITPTELVNPKVQIYGHLKFNVLVTSTSEFTFNMFADKGWEFRGCDLLEKKSATGGSKQ